MRKRSKMMPRTDAASLGKFVTLLVTGNPITEEISPLEKVRLPDLRGRESGRIQGEGKRRASKRGE